MLNSMSSILHFMHPLRADQPKSDHVSEKAAFFGPLQFIFISISPPLPPSPSFCMCVAITAWKSGHDNCDIKSWNVPESTTCPLGPRGEQEESVVRSRQVMAEWPNCLSCCLSRPAKPPIFLIITEEQ